MKCDYYNKSGHSKQDCYNLVIYPVDFKNKKSYGANIVTSGSENDKPTHQDEGKICCDLWTLG